MIQHDPNDLEDLKKHILEELRLGYDYSHGGITFNESDFDNPEMDLKQVFYYKKSYFDDLESGVRSWIFETITNIEYEPTSVVLEVKTTKTSKTGQYLDAKSGYLYDTYDM